MEQDEKKKLKYVAPECDTMEFSPGCILAGSSDPGGWGIDNSGTSAGSSSAGASSGSWGIDDSSTGASSSSTGASTGSWSTD